MKHLLTFIYYILYSLLLITAYDHFHPQTVCPTESSRIQSLQKGLDEVYREQVACNNHLQQLLKARSTCEVDRDACAMDYEELGKVKDKWQELAHDCVKELTRVTSTTAGSREE